MPRKARNYYVADFYHIMIQGDEKKFIFKKNSAKEKYIYLLKRNSFRNDIKIIAYCVMDNHVHILLHCKEIERISKMMQQCNTSFGMYYSKQRNNVGHVFRDRFVDEPIYDKTYLINCIKYIHLNPVKANIVKECSDYPFSSYNDYLNNINPIFENVLSTCDFSFKNLVEIINNSHIDESIIEKFLEDTPNVNMHETLKELLQDYDINNLSHEKIIEIYSKLKCLCKVNKTQLAKVLNIKKTTFFKMIENYEN